MIEQDNQQKSQVQFFENKHNRSVQSLNRYSLNPLAMAKTTSLPALKKNYNSVSKIRQAQHVVNMGKNLSQTMNDAPTRKHTRRFSQQIGKDSI
jgi:hypothetical protein